MRKIKLFLTLLMLMCIGVTQMWGETVTYAQTSTSAASVSSGTAPAGSSVTFSNTYTTKEQLTAGNSMTLTLSGYAGYKITGITLSMKSNKSAGSGSFSAVAGSTTIASITTAAFNDASWNGSYSQTYVNVTPTMSNADYAIQENENVVLTIAATVKSLYCESFTITYAEAGGDDPTPPTPTCTNKVTLSKGAATFDIDKATSEALDCCAEMVVTLSNINIPNGKRIKAITQSGIEGVTINQENKTVTYPADSNGESTIDVTFEDIPTHKISFNTGGLVVIADATDIQEGTSYNISQTPAGSITDICEYKTFVGWTRSSSITNPSVSPAIEGASIQMGNGDITLYAVYSKTEGGSSPINDVLNNALTGISGTNYVNWSDKTSNSDAVYAGNSAGGNDAIQLRSNNSNSGIVTTTSGGKATKVTVEWNSNTAATRTITIYGKNSAYSAATDLYGSNAGTSLGDLNIDNATNNVSELTITGDYEYIGIRSKNGALYLNSVTITWGSSGSISYSLNPNCVEPECANPTINTQPAESAEYAKNAGSVTALSVAATAATGTLTYQWYSNTTASNEGGEAIDGATNASYTPAVDVAGVFYYYCVVGIKDDVCKTASDVATITVTQAVGSVALDETAIALIVEATQTLTPTVLPIDATNKAVSWESSNPAVATVDENGLVTAVAKGTATITCKSQEDENIKATCEVTVTAPLPTITITAEQIADFTNTYAEYDWTASGVSGKTYAYKNAGIQLNSDKVGHYVYNTTPVPGNITKITMTKASGSARTWTPYVSDEAMTTTVEGKNITSKEVASTTEWEVTGSNQYFYLNVAGGSTVIGSIVITYEPILSAVTVDGEIAHGSVAVSGAEDKTAVAAGTELTLTATPESDEYQLKDYNVFKTGEPATKITVTNGKFIMPLYGVTVSAEFEVSKELDHLVITSEASQKTFWVGEDFNYDGLAIKAVYDNETEKENVIPKSISTPDMSEAGVKTVTIAYQEKEIEKTTSYEITVKALPTEENPASVAEIRDIYDKFGDTENMFVRGTIYKINGFYSEKYISYWITDAYAAGENPNHTNEFELYNGLDFNEASFTAQTDLELGQEVVVKGNLTRFGSSAPYTYEFSTGNIIISRPKYVKSIALSEGYKTAFNDDEAFSHEGVVVTATYNYGDDETVNATWSEPVMTQLGEQEVTVSYTYEGKTVEFKYTITITHVCAPENLVAVTKGEEVNGAYSLSAEEVCTEGDGATVDVTDIVPAEGYRFKEITTSASGNVDNDLKKVTGIKAATTITVVFEQIPSYDVTWNVNGETSTTKVQEGSKPTFPNTPESCDATSTAFYGWATAPWTGKAENLNEKTVYTSAADMPEVMAAGTIYYAVFAKATEVPGEEHTLTLVESDFGLTTTYAEHTATKSGIGFTVNQGYKGSGNVIQMNSSKGTGSLYNTTAIAGLKSVTVNVASGEKTYDITTGTEQNPTANKQQSSATGTFNAVAGDTYFQLKVSGASYFSSIVVTYAEVAYEYSEFLTTCCTKYDITIDSEIEHGSVSADLAKACEGATVTLTPAADPAYHFDAWSVSYNDGENDHPVTVTENKFTMPAAAVTVSATFEHDPCQGLEKPALDGEIVVDYQSAIIAWNEVENASSYVLNITEGETPVVENASITDLTDLSYLVENLTANTTYNYSIMAVGDGIDYCATNTALEGNFTTVELPAAHLILSENGEEFEFEENQHKLNDVVTLPSELHYSGCTGKVLKGWSKAAVAEQDEEPTENYYAAGTQYTIGATADKLYAVFATEGAGQASTLFEETFDNCTSTGGNDNAWSNTIANGTLSLEGWTVVSGNAASGCAKFGASKAAGSAETPAIEITGAATLTFRAGAWSGDNTTLKISASGATLDQSSVTIASAAWNSYSVAISEATGSVKIKFESNVTNKGRFFLDDVVVSQSAISYSAYTTSCDAALEVPTFSLNPVVTPEEEEYKEAINVVIATEVEDAIIYYTTNGNNPTTASAVYSEPITLNTCGEHTIKAFVKKDAQESAIATATYTLAIPVPASGVTPFTPQQAIDVYNSGCYNNEQVHVKGVVTGASYNETLQNNAAAYNGSYNVFVKEIGDNSENPVTYEFYRMWKDNNNNAFTKGDIKAGDTITATGTMTKYQTTYEFNAGCYMESYVAYDEPKTDISNTVDNPYTVEVADGLIENIQSDLTKTVFVKGIITAFPSSTKVTIRDTENGEEYLELYKSTLADGISALVIGDQIIVTGIMQKYNNQTYQMNEGCQVVWKKAKVVIEIAAMNMVVNDVATITPTSVTPEAAAEAITYSIKEGSDECITLNDAQITATAAGTATIIATVETAETYIGTSIEFTVTVAAQADTRKTAQDLDGFAAISGDLNNEISFEAKKGDASTDPITYGNPAFIRIYQGGGYLAIDAAKGCTIDEVIITIPEGCNNTTIGVGTDEDNLPETGSAATAGNTFSTGTGMNSQHVYLVCLGTSKTTRLEIGTIVVKYTGEAQAVDHYSVIADNVVTTEFPKNGTFSSEGLVVYACYDTNCEDYVDITDQCNVVADLTSIGEKKAEVYLGEEKLGEYDITVVAGQEDPALAYTPASETIPAAGIGGWVAPTLNNPFNVTPSYNTNNAAVATVDESGVIALAGGYGKAVITASFAETEDYIASVATYTITVQEPANKIAGKWMVAGAEDIKPGIKVIVVGEKNSIKYTMGTQNSNNRAAVAAQSIVADTLYAAEGTKTFTLVDAGDGKYAFLANNGMYLYAASSSSNQLKEQATINGNATWSIAIANDGKATIQAQGTNSRNLMSMTPNGNNNPLFSCYKDEQSAIKLYVNRNQIDGSDDPANPAEVAISDNVVEEEIVANGNVIVTVNTDNFEEPKSYIAQNGATIVINGNGAEEAKSVIADEQSTIQVNQPTTVNQVFSVSATMGAGLSGQITGVDNVTIAESTEAYFDITLGDNANPNKWHAIAVPFPVDAISGIYDAETGAKLNNEEHYAIMDYHGDIRATGAYGWKKFRGIMTPGVFYLMTVDGNTKTFRFKMSGVTLPTATSLALQLFAASGDGQSTDAGWNGVANPTLQHGTVNQTVTVLNPNTYTYEDKDAGEMNFVVGTPYFIQANATIVAQGMEMGAVDDTKPYYAPKRVSENGFENIKVFFGNEEYKDKLTISANVEALNEYQIGKDLVKMTMTNTPSVAQIFGNAYNTKLCRVYAPMANDQAEYSLTLYAPNAGEYTISAPEMEDADIFLTYEGSIIWNLSMSAYTNNFAKGNNERYGLILVKKAPQVVTGVDNAEANEAGVQKVIINKHVYILRAEQMYDVTGKMVK